MARGKTLENLVQQLRSECRNSSAVNVGVDFNDIYKQTLRRVYEFLYDDYDWPHLLIKPTKDLADGQYLYDLPADLDLERIEEVYCWYSGYPHPLERGINIIDYNEYSSSAGEKVDPVRKWDLYWAGTATQVEVWPMPASNVQQLQFVGRRKYTDLVQDTDVALLDDRLIVLFAAAEILADQKNPSANQKLALARERYSRLKGRVTGGSRMITLGGTSGDEDRPRGTIIRVS